MYQTDFQVDRQDVFMNHFEEELNWSFDANLYFAGWKDALGARNSHLVLRRER